MKFDQLSIVARSEGHGKYSNQICYEYNVPPHTAGYFLCAQREFSNDIQYVDAVRGRVVRYFKNMDIDVSRMNMTIRYIRNGNQSYNI
jgi:hypothetical protein